MQTSVFQCSIQPCRLASMCAHYQAWERAYFSGEVTPFTDDPRKDNGHCHLFTPREIEE